MWYLSVFVHRQFIGSEGTIQRAVQISLIKHKVPGPMKSTGQLKTDRTIALVGLMGAGKSAIGCRLGIRLGLPFIDADVEIEKNAGKTISHIFELEGEKAFRKCERRIIRRLLQRPVHVLATGGGAFVDRETRRLIRKKALSIWLRADLETLLQRVLRRSDRPLLMEGDPRQILANLINERDPIYALADIVIDSVDSPHEEMIDKVVNGIISYDRLRGLTDGSRVDVKESQG